MFEGADVVHKLFEETDADSSGQLDPDRLYTNVDMFQFPLLKNLSIRWHLQSQTWHP